VVGFRYQQRDSTQETRSVCPEARVRPPPAMVLPVSDARSVCWPYVFVAGEHHWPWESRPAEHDSKFLEKDIPMPWEVWCGPKKSTGKR